MKMYHGTTKQNAIQIATHGFDAYDGMLGRGVYTSRDIRKAHQYGPGRHGANGVIMELEVDVGRVYVISDRSDRNDHWQMSFGQYDSAWVKPGVQDSGEENCIRDPCRIRVTNSGVPATRDRPAARRASPPSTVTVHLGGYGYSTTMGGGRGGGGGVPLGQLDMNPRSPDFGCMWI